MKTYCLSGFGTTLDCRPIVLLEPPPEELCCVFCNVVSATPSPLPCGHQACRVCCREVLLRGNICPFDKVTFAKDSVQSEGKAGFRRDVALSCIEARCFNFPFGCPFTGTLRELELHFPDGCNHHKVTCLNCSKDVLQSLLAEHIFSGCVEHVPLTPPASSVENEASTSSHRRLSALENTIEERFRALLVSSAVRSESQPDAPGDASPAASSNGSMTPRCKIEPHTLSPKNMCSAPVSNGNVAQHEEAPSPSTQPTPPSQGLPRDREAISPPRDTSSSSSSSSRQVLSGRGALHVLQYWRIDEATGAQDVGNSNDGTLWLGEHFLKLGYAYAKQSNGDVVILFLIMLHEDVQERPKNGGSLPRSPGPKTKAKCFFDGLLALSLRKPGSNEEQHPLPTYVLPERVPKGDGWSVVARTIEVDWKLVEQCLDADTLHFCVRLE